MHYLEKYWRHFNLIGAVVTFLFGMFLVIWGINAIAPYNEEMVVRIRAATKIETLRLECHEINEKIKFAQGAGQSLIQIELVFLCFIFILFALNVRLVRRIEAKENTNTPS